MDGNNEVWLDGNKIVVVAGPTASGKTSLAVALAEKYSGEVVSADSRQVYRGMDLGTGKDLSEYGKIRYHCIDIVDPKEVYTLFHYQRECYSSLKSCFEREKIPVLCGGTGLYIEAVLNSYKIPNVPENVQFRESQTLREKSELEAELLRRAPDIHAETDCSSKKRVIRSLEVAIARESGPISYSSEFALPLNPTILITDWDADQLRQRITTRMHERFEEGMIEEVAAMKQREVSDQRLDLFGLEYREINRYLNGLYSYQELCDSLEQGIFHLAKRQRTWFRGMERRGLEVHTIPGNSFDHAVAVLRSSGFEI